MKNAGEYPSVNEQGVKVGQKGQMMEDSNKTRRQQPGQGTSTRKNKKIVTSKPMDYSEIVQAQSLFDKKGTLDNAETTTDDYGNKTFKSNDYTQVLLNQMNRHQLVASERDEDLRKRLRVDRVRKMTMGQSAFDVKTGSMQSAVADPSQPDWARYKSLREIDQVRQAKKDAIIN